MSGIESVRAGGGYMGLAEKKAVAAGERVLCTLSQRQQEVYVKAMWI